MIEHRPNTRRVPLAASSWRLAPGMMIAAGRFVAARLGGGADFEVFAVDDVELGRCVAKLVRPDVLAAGEACAVIAREASALSAVRTDGVVRCLEVDLHGRHPHLLLEYVAGPTLRGVLRRQGALERGEVAVLGARLATTLAEIAAGGWLHLDVKPENIVMGAAARLLDFSIAQRADAAVTSEQLVGTPAYMAPEQRAAAGTRLGAAADVYALATTLAEALTGELPPRGVRPDPLPGPFEALLGPALCGQPDARPGAAELARALGGLGYRNARR
jgi:serine/threonine protein kinase